MPCTSPITGWRSRTLSANGKRPIVFNPNHGYKDMEVTVPCGRCTGCRLEYSRQWALRCVHESQMHEENIFITLTYKNEELPESGTVVKSDLQKFFKRLRKNTGKRFKYFACGEYGDKTHRPHYHAVLFGIDFPDRFLHTITDRGHALWRSPTLEKSWDKGHSLIGEVNFDTCAYVARYVMKKRKGDPDEVDPKTGKTNAEFYQRCDPETGEFFEVDPEFCLMSRGSGKKDDPDIFRYGIGRTWFDQFRGDTNKDYLTNEEGVKMALPKYYDNIIAAENELEMMDRKKRRKRFINPAEQTPDRLEAKRKVIEAKNQLLERNLE